MVYPRRFKRQLSSLEKLTIVAYEALVKGSAGLYSMGDEVTLADITLAPTVEAAMRWGVDFSQLPIIEGIYDRLKVLPAFEKGDWKHQPDTPEQFVAKERIISG